MRLHKEGLHSTIVGRKTADKKRSESTTHYAVTAAVHQHTHRKHPNSPKCAYALPKFLHSSELMESFLTSTLLLKQVKGLRHTN